jgi:hypothetical protein
MFAHFVILKKLMAFIDSSFLLLSRHDRISQPHIVLLNPIFGGAILPKLSPGYTPHLRKFTALA